MKAVFYFDSLIFGILFYQFIQPNICIKVNFYDLDYSYAADIP